MASTGKRKASGCDSRVDQVSPPPTKKKTITSTTTKSSVQSFFTPVSKKPPPPISWRIIEKSLVTGVFRPADDVKTAVSSSTETIVLEKTNGKDDTIEGTSTKEVVIVESTTTNIMNDAQGKKDTIRIAAFDLDSTLIRTASGNTFSKDSTDWAWWHVSVPHKLRELHASNHLIVLFSNQNGIKLISHKSEKRYDAFKTKVTAMCTALDLPVRIYAATEVDQFRKPRTAMFEHFLEDLGEDAWKFEAEESLFVGDAAGRDGDHSAADRQFAKNTGIRFLTPEEFFLGEAPKPYKDDIDISQFIDDVPKPLNFAKLQPLELVIFVGSPGAGKSTFYWNMLEPLGFKRVNQDLLKTRDKCIKVAKEHLAAGKSVAVDNTNADTKVRSLWKEIASVNNATFRCVHFTTPAKLCIHNDKFRAYAVPTVSMNPESRSSLPGIAFSGFTSRYIEPTTDEGFADITRVEFKFRGTDAQKEVWSKFWS